MPVKLTPRLMTAVSYVRGDRLLADVGTDHAYLPIYLCEQGKLTPVSAGNGETLCAIASDIHKGPVERADQHIAAAGLTNRIKTKQTDGLRGLDVYDPADIVIFGMGGELIATILQDSPWVNRVGKRLILQPMTHAEKLREYLLTAGFSIVGETLSGEGERIYQTICAEPTPGANPPTLTPAELSVGQAAYRLADAEQRALYITLIHRTIRTETAARDARRGAGQDTAEQDSLIASLTALEKEI